MRAYSRTLWLLLVSSATVGRGEESLTLESLVAEAQTNNPAIRAFAADIDVARGDLTTAQTWPNPELSVTPGVAHTRDPSQVEFHGDFGLEQTIEYPGKRALRRALAEKNVAQRQFALDGFRRQLAVHVRRAYYELLASQKIVSLREQGVALAKGFTASAKAKFEAGFAPEFEVNKAEVEVVTGQKALRDAQAQVWVARGTLNALLGHPPTNALVVAGTLHDGVSLPSEAALLSQALARNPSVRIQEAEAERAGLTIQTVRRSRYPDFSIGPNVEYRLDEQIYGLGVRLPLPLWDRKRGELATATAEQKKALAELERLRQEILRDVANAYQRLAAAKESLGYYTPALRDKLRAALDAAALSYAEGRTSVLVYLETQRTYFATQADYFETLHTLYDAQAELEAALGVPLAEPPAPTESKENPR